MVTAANISCACSRSPNGIAPHCHFADGYLNLLLIRRVSFCEKVKLLLTLSNSDKRKLVVRTSIYIWLKIDSVATLYHHYVAVIL
jgi:hypothetical protein